MKGEAILSGFIIDCDLGDGIYFWPDAGLYLEFNPIYYSEGDMMNDLWCNIQTHNVKVRLMESFI